jgi:hypothetical protein
MIEFLERFRGGMLAGIAALLLACAGWLALPPERASANLDCDSIIDLMLVLDGSESISSADFDLTRDFVDSLIGHFVISPTDGHAGIVQFAGEGQGRVEIGLSSDPAAITAASAAMLQIIGATDIQEGITLGQGQLTYAGRPGVPHAMIIVTDGEHNQPGDPIAEADLARSLGTEIFAIAVGPGPNMAELGAIASDPDGEHVFSVSGFGALTTILDQLVQVVCPVKPTPTLPPPTGPTATPGAPGAPDGPPVAATPVFGEYEGDVLGTIQLPPVGTGGLPDDWAHRARKLAAQGLAGLGGALLLVGATRWVAGRRERR